MSLDRPNISKQLYSTEDSIFDGRNNTIRRNEAGIRGIDRHETSLNKNSINTPTNIKRMTFLQTQTQEDAKNHNFSLPKTAATISNKTEHFICPSNHTINNVEALTQKEINIHQSLKEPCYDKKGLSKQLLSQIHFCRFLYKLLIRMR